MRERKRRTTEPMTRAGDPSADEETDPELQMVRDDEGRCREIHFQCGLRIKL